MTEALSEAARLDAEDKRIFLAAKAFYYELENAGITERGGIDIDDDLLSRINGLLRTTGLTLVREEIRVHRNNQLHEAREEIERLRRELRGSGPSQTQRFARRA